MKTYHACCHSSSAAYLHLPHFYVNLPGGKRDVEKGETLWECCRRECREETTIELPTEEPTLHFKLRGGGKVRVYFLKLDHCPDLSAFKPGSEIADCQWREPVDNNYNQPHDDYQLKETLLYNPPNPYFFLKIV